MLALSHRHLRRALFVALLFSLALNLLILTVPLYMTAVYDRVLSSRSLETLMMISAVAVGALVLTGFLESVRQVVLTRAGARFEADLGGEVLAATIRAGLQTGNDVQPLRDLAQVRQFLSSPLVGALFDAPVAPFYLVLIFLVHPHLGWITAGCAVLLVAISVLTQQITKVPLKQAARHGQMAFHNAQAQLRNAEVIRAMGMHAEGVRAWGEHNNRAMAAADSAARRNAVLSGLTKFVRLLLQVGILGYGAYLVLSDYSLSGGIIFAASIISSRALAPLDQAIGGWRTFEQAQQAYSRVMDLLRATTRERDVMDLPAPRATLGVERLVYGPPGGQAIIKGMTFQIDAGEVVGVIGPSGAGKSTLARLLVGAIRPSSGLVRIGGDDLTHWSAEAIGPYLGYVPQDIELFPATVAQNIARMAASPDATAVVAAARQANCHELIQRLPDGYDTVVGPGGFGLSGGQRQRIALARAFYGNPRIVILDEPNASLDSEGEEALLAALVEAGRAGTTCVVIAQRTSILPAVTKLMVLRDGRVEAFGPRDEVLRSQGLTPQRTGEPMAANQGERRGPAAGQPGTAVPARLLSVMPISVTPGAKAGDS